MEWVNKIGKTVKKQKWIGSVFSIIGYKKILAKTKMTLIYKYVFLAVSKLPVKQNVIWLESYFGKQYSCNPRAIYEYLREHCPEYKMYWSADPRYVHVFEQHRVPYVRRFSLRWLFIMARARFWVTNCRLPLWIPKPSHTIYLQTWHGTPLKKLAHDIEEVHMPGTDTEKYKRNFSRDVEKWDYLISPNAYSTRIFAGAFRFPKERMLETGYPRNDFLYTHNKPEYIRQLKERLRLPLDKKVMLYAPTWRDNQFYEKGKYKFDLKLDLKRLQEEIGDRYIVLLRMHYLVAEQFDLSAHRGFAYDFSKHEDIRELYLLADLLVTDYSSVFFDYANLKRPMIFFVYDIEEYRDTLRGFYFDFEREAPGPLVKTTESLIQAIKAIEEGSYPVDTCLQPFYERFCHWEDGNAARRVAEKVFCRKEMS